MIKPPAFRLIIGNSLVFRIGFVMGFGMAMGVLCVGGAIGLIDRLLKLAGA